jgi:hypothetical protein
VLQLANNFIFFVNQLKMEAPLNSITFWSIKLFTPEGEQVHL